MDLCDALNRIFLDLFPLAPRPGMRGEARSQFVATPAARKIEISERVVAGRKRDKTEKLRPIGFVTEHDFADLTAGLPKSCGNLTKHAGKISKCMLEIAVGAERDHERAHAGRDDVPPVSGSVGEVAR